MRQPLALLLILAAATLVGGCGFRTVPATELEATAVREEPAKASAAREGEVRQAVTRSLPFLEAEGVAWIEKHSCVTCHQVPTMVWSLNDAARQGFEVDPVMLERWNRWTLEQAQEVGKDNTDGIFQLIVAHQSGTLDAELRADLEELADVVVASQQADGSWSPGGQLPGQRRPKEETQAASTQWALLALSAMERSSPALERAREHLTAWESMAGSGVSTEHLMLRLLLATKAGDDDAINTAHDALLAVQNADGGWGWLQQEASDAFGTGQSLYALGRAGLDPEAPVIERARTFLLTTQNEDGTWTVPSTLATGHGPEPTSIYWGTGWATLGLLATLPAPADRAESMQASLNSVD